MLGCIRIGLCLIILVIMIIIFIMGTGLLLMVGNEGILSWVDIFMNHVFMMIGQEVTRIKFWLLDASHGSVG